jgi:hypothetical protein
VLGLLGSRSYHNNAIAAKDVGQSVDQSSGFGGVQGDANLLFPMGRSLGFLAGAWFQATSDFKHAAREGVMDHSSGDKTIVVGGLTSIGAGLQAGLAFDL